MMGRRRGDQRRLFYEFHLDDRVPKNHLLHQEITMNANNIWLIVTVVLVVLSVILAIMDRSFLSPMYLLVLAIVVMLGTSVKFPW